MKYVYIMIVTAMSILPQFLYSQDVIAVQNGGAATFFTNLQEAIASAQNGDTIYIPGGSYNDVTIEKTLNLVGVGHHPDSTDATAKTIIKGLTIASGADWSSITGISFGNESINFISDNHNLTIKRCYLMGRFQFHSTVTNVSNLCLIENILGSITLTSCTNSTIINNIFTGQLTSFSGLIKNNIFLAYNPTNYYPYSLTASNNVIENNIFNNIQISSFSNCIFRNNVNYFWDGSDYYGNQGSDNFSNPVALQSVFINYDPATMEGGEAIYNADFHLKPNSSYKNSGRDGTDIGIYGGAFPWKEGSVPFNPHFQAVHIAPTTDNTGKLNVNIKVAAQDR